MLIDELTIEGWTDETRRVEATALVLMFDLPERRQAVEDAVAMLADDPVEGDQTTASAVAILEAIALARDAASPLAAQALLTWLSGDTA